MELNLTTSWKTTMPSALSQLHQPLRHILPILIVVVGVLLFNTIRPAKVSGQVPPQNESQGEADQEEPESTSNDASDSVDESSSNSSSDSSTALEEFKALTEAKDLNSAADAGKDLLIRYGIPAMVAILLLIVSYFIAAFISRIASRPVKSRVDETLGRFVDKLVFYVIMLGAVLGIMQYFGIGVSSFAAVIAAAGFAIGLAFQGTLSNFAAGIMLLVFRPFKVGHVINAAGVTAKVYEIDLFHTVFDTFDNRRIIVPNGEIFSGTIENISYHVERRVDVSVGVEYSADIRKTREVLSQAAESIRERMIEGENRGYQIVLGDLGDSAVGWTVRFWTTADDFFATKEALTEAVKVHLDQAGIGIPFPQMDIHLFKQES